MGSFGINIDGVWIKIQHSTYYQGPPTRNAKLRVAHAPGMPGTFSPPLWVSNPDIHHGSCIPHVPWCMFGSLTNDFLWSRWRGKRSRHSRCVRNQQYYVSGKRPMWKITATLLWPQCVQNNYTKYCKRYICCMFETNPWSTIGLINCS